MINVPPVRMPYSNSVPPVSAGALPQGAGFVTLRSNSANAAPDRPASQPVGLHLRQSWFPDGTTGGVTGQLIPEALVTILAELPQPPGLAGPHVDRPALAVAHPY